MLALSLLFIPVILGPLLSELSPAAERGMELTGWAIWGAFVVEYLWLLYLAPERVNMVKTHKLDLLVVLLPFLRPLRILRFLRLASAASGFGRAARRCRVAVTASRTARRVVDMNRDVGFGRDQTRDAVGA